LFADIFISNIFLPLIKEILHGNLARIDKEMIEAG